MLNDTIYIVGGGPSLSGFPFAKLYRHQTMTVNSAIFDVPTAGWFVSMDYTFIRKAGIQPSGIPSRGDYFNSLKCKKHFVIGFDAPRLKKIDALTYEDTQFGLRYDLRQFDRVTITSGYGGLGDTFETFKTGSESGYAAIQLAVVLGFKKIYLLGFDFTTKFGNTHYHDRYTVQDDRQYREKLQEFLCPYRDMVQQAKQMGVQIVSLSPISRLNEFVPVQKWQEVLD